MWNILDQLAAMTDLPGVMIERDANIPPYAELLAELDVARDIAARATERGAQAREAAE